jgi:diguanylate cyclase (GGDEF)-like protein/PAS domain S-box-containing protein
MEKKTLRILIVEDAPPDAELCQRELKRAGLEFSALRVDNREEFERALREYLPDLILSDFSMPNAFDGLTALDLARAHSAEVPFVFVSGTIGEDRAVEAMRRGATDYVLKDRLGRLGPVVRRALEEVEVRRQRRRIERELRESQERFRALLEAAPDGIALVNGDGVFVLVNAEMERLFGYTKEDLLGKPVESLVPEAQRAGHIGYRSEYLARPRTRRMASSSDLQGLRKDGSMIPVEISLSPIVLGDAIHVICVIRDVTERRVQEERIERLSRIRELHSSINAAIVRIRDRRQLCEEACRIAVEHGGFGIAWIGTLNPETLDIIPVSCAGVEADSLVASARNTARPDHALGRGFVGRAVREKRAVFSNDLLTEASVGGERRKEALSRGYRSIITLPLLVEGSVAGILSLFAKEPGFFDDEEIKLLTELADDVSFALAYIAKEEHLNYLAYYDVLTGLPNRTLFQDRLEQRVSAARRDGQIFSVMMLDIERFRHINETLGRRAGDELLREFTARLKSAVEETDVLAYLGGDYFAIATRRAGEAADIMHLLEQILSAVAGQPYHLGGSELRIAARAGVALYPSDGTDGDHLLKNAEAALKDAKRTGNRHLFYAPQMNARVAEQLKLESDLRRAVLEEQFVLHYQPRVALANGRMSGFEALIRWRHPERGLVPPGEFIPLLEGTGLILEVGRWALKKAAQDHAAWRAAGLNPMRIAVNVSAVQLRRPEFVEDVRAALAETGGFHRIDIEITESMLMDDIEGNIGKLRALQEMGVNVAMDDFGTGYCSMSYLAKLPINSLKVDRSFVSPIDQGAEQMAIVSTIVSLAQALNLKVCAEGVETQDQANLLRLLRCDEAQGFFFGRPEPGEQVERLLSQP